MSGPPPASHWLLIAVLSSNIPLRPEVSMRLYQAAYRLHHSQQGVETLQGDLLTGKVMRLSKDLALGTVTGPAFEAEISTAQGEGRVHFLLTRQGLELGDEAMAAGASEPPGTGLPPGLAKSGGYLN
jgi:hypothetical protein